jgi:DNA-binding NarL/FixJ family response regulator
MDPITIVLVDDHCIVREGLRAMLETDPQLQVVGEAADGQEALERVAELQPAVVLMDIRMPGLDGLEVTRRLKREHPHVAVIVISGYDDSELVLDALRAGAVGYLPKRVSRPLLLHSIAVVVQGGVVTEAALLRTAFTGPDPVGKPAHAALSTGAGQELLTPREQEVLALLAEGRTNKEIGEALALAEVTIKKHVQTIIAKLQATDRTSAVMAGVRIGLIE